MYYTPTTEDVFDAYNSEGDGGIANIPDHSQEAFDRWLNGVRAAAWAEGFDAGEQDFMSHVTWDEPCIKNPYGVEE